MRFPTLAGLSLFVVVCAAVPMSDSAAVEQPSQAAGPVAGITPEAEIQSEPPGEGVLCGWGFIVLAREVGKLCFAGQDAEFQARLNESVSRMDQYVIKNGKFTAADVARFKKEQGQEGAPASILCHGDPVEIYKGYRSRGAAAIKSLTDAMVSRPRKPTWGTCT